MNLNYKRERRRDSSLSASNCLAAYLTGGKVFDALCIMTDPVLQIVGLSIFSYLHFIGCKNTILIIFNIKDNRQR